jgi:hypothetical protein
MIRKSMPSGLTRRVKPGFPTKIVLNQVQLFPRYLCADSVPRLKEKDVMPTATLEIADDLC